MKTYFHQDTVIALIDSIEKPDPVLTHIYKSEVNVKQINDIISGLKKLGKEIEKITISSGSYLDMDSDVNVYYKRFPESVTTKVWNDINNWRSSDREVHIKGNRIYVNEA